MNKKGRVTIISRESDSRTLDVGRLEAELLSRGLEVKVLSRLLTKDLSAKMLSYGAEVLKQEAAILGSDVVVLDTYCIPASMLPHRRRTKIVQMWHALAAVKKFGWQTVGLKDGSSARTASLMRMHRGYDHVVCASDITAEHFCEAFRTDKSRIAKYGLPRIDYIKSVSRGERREEMRSKILRRYPQLGTEDKRTVLYVPTFRRNTELDLTGLIESIDKEKFDLVIKLHPLYRHVKNEAEDREGVIFDDEFSSFDWLSAADIIISDYSSLVVESTAADRPLYLYTYDMDEYRGSTGLNMDFEKEPIADYVFSDAAELAKALEEPYDMEKLRAFRERYIDIDTGNCTSDLADFIESLI